MDRDIWSSQEKDRLIDAVKKFKAKHGNVQVDWKILAEDAQLTRFKPVQVRQKYFNLKKKEWPKCQVTTSKTRKPNEVESPFKNLGSDEIAMIQGVRPTTATSFDFMNHLGYGKKSDKTMKYYADQLHTSIKLGKFGADWVKELDSKSSKLADYSRQTRRDMENLRKDCVKSTSNEERSRKIADRQENGSLMYTQGTSCVNGRPEKPGPSRDNVSQASGPVVSAASKPKNLPRLGRKTLNISEESSDEEQEETSKTPNLVYKKIISGPYGDVIPTPSGYGYQHKLRKLTDNEWRKIILQMQQSAFYICSNEYHWKKLAEKSDINCSLNGSDIQIEFCKYAIPRFEKLVSNLAEYKNPEEFHQLITESSRLVHMMIFHSMKDFQFKFIKPAVCRLEKLKIISVQEISVKKWCQMFINLVLRENKDYFSCSEENLEKLRENVIESAVDICESN